jgi:hypothetical protein
VAVGDNIQAPRHVREFIGKKAKFAEAASAVTGAPAANELILKEIEGVLPNILPPPKHPFFRGCIRSYRGCSRNDY